MITFLVLHVFVFAVLLLGLVGNDITRADIIGRLVGSAAIAAYLRLLAEGLSKDKTE